MYSVLEVWVISTFPNTSGSGRVSSAWCSARAHAELSFIGWVCSTSAWCTQHGSRHATCTRVPHVAVMHPASCTVPVSDSE